MEALPTLKERFRRSSDEGLRRMLPDQKLKYAWCIASLDWEVSAGCDSWRWRIGTGGSVAREAKELTTSAWLWAQSEQETLRPRFSIRIF